MREFAEQTGMAHRWGGVRDGSAVGPGVWWLVGCHGGGLRTGSELLAR